MGGDGGFTFIEVMVALAIVASLLVTVAYTMSFNLDVAGRHEAQTVATILARDKATMVKEDPRGELKEKKGEFGEPFEEYSYEVEKKDRVIFLGLPVEVSELTVTVTGRGETVTLRKIFRKSDLAR